MLDEVLSKVHNDNRYGNCWISEKLLFCVGVFSSTIPCMRHFKSWCKYGNLCYILLSLVNLCFRDQYFSIKFPNGPKNRKVDLSTTWFQGNTPFFLTRGGGPVRNVNLSHFSKLCGFGVKAGDLRKIYTTELAHHSKQVI